MKAINITLNSVLKILKNAFGDVEIVIQPCNSQNDWWIRIDSWKGKGSALFDINSIILYNIDKQWMELFKSAVKQASVNTEELIELLDEHELELEIEEEAEIEKMREESKKTDLFSDEQYEIDHSFDMSRFDNESSAQNIRS